VVWVRGHGSARVVEPQGAAGDAAQRGRVKVAYCSDGSTYWARSSNLRAVEQASAASTR
jgi:uncharacterized protein involved in type VI secretion and phage assembly